MVESGNPNCVFRGIRRTGKLTSLGVEGRLPLPLEHFDGSHEQRSREPRSSMAMLDNMARG